MADAERIASPELLQFTPSQPSQRNGANSVARRRYQKGSVKIVNGKFRGRWREDVILPNGTVKRLNRKMVLGTKEDFRTQREARRKLDLILAPINSLDYRPTHQITFAEFAHRWLENVLPTYKPGWSQATTRRQVRNRLIPVFGDCDLKDINTEVLQTYIAALLKKGNSAKYIRNIISTASAMWAIALAWNYVAHKPFEGLILPPLTKPESDAYSLEEALTIFRAAQEPFKTFLWILGECGMRPAEACGLDAKYIHLADRVISVRQSESMGRIVTPKTVAGYRDFAMSVPLAEHCVHF
jgi:integrase